MFVLFCACVAALAAHLAIDAFGDVLLAHDAFDNVNHSSRLIVFGAAMFGGFAVAWRIVARAFDDALSGTRLLRRAALYALAGSPWLCTLLVVPTTFAVLAAMGIADTALDGHAFDGVADLFGGSLSLGCAITSTCAVGTAFAAWSVLRRIVAAHHALVDAIIALISLLVRLDAQLGSPRLDDGIVSQRLGILLLAQRHGKRAPPTLPI